MAVHVVLDEHVVLEDGDLGAVAVLAHAHHPVDRLPTGQELSLGEDRGAPAAGLAAVAAALLLGLDASRSAHGGDLVGGLAALAHLDHGVRRVVGGEVLHLLGHAGPAATSATATGARGLRGVVALGLAVGLLVGVLRLGGACGAVLVVGALGLGVDVLAGLALLTSALARTATATATAAAATARCTVRVLGVLAVVAVLGVRVGLVGVCVLGGLRASVPASGRLLASRPGAGGAGVAHVAGCLGGLVGLVGLGSGGLRALGCRLGTLGCGRAFAALAAHGAGLVRRLEHGGHRHLARRTGGLGDHGLGHGGEGHGGHSAGGATRAPGGSGGGLGGGGLGGGVGGGLGGGVGVRPGLRVGGGLGRRSVGLGSSLLAGGPRLVGSRLIGSRLIGSRLVDRRLADLVPLVLVDGLGRVSRRLRCVLVEAELLLRGLGRLRELDLGGLDSGRASGAAGRTPPPRRRGRHLGRVAELVLADIDHGGLLTGSARRRTAHAGPCVWSDRAHAARQSLWYCPGCARGVCV